MSKDMLGKKQLYEFFEKFIQSPEVLKGKQFKYIPPEILSVVFCPTVSVRRRFMAGAFAAAGVYGRTKESKSAIRHKIFILRFIKILPVKKFQ